MFRQYSMPTGMCSTHALTQADEIHSGKLFGPNNYIKKTNLLQLLSLSRNQPSLHESRQLALGSVQPLLLLLSLALNTQSTLHFSLS